MHKDILYLGSQSSARQKLLKQADIPFKVLAHSSDEKEPQEAPSFEAYVLSIAQSKIKALTLPTISEALNDYIFVLTADTLVRTMQTNKIMGKPKDLEDGKAMIRIIRKEPVIVTTGCCLEKMVYENGTWELAEFKHFTTSTEVEFCIDEASLDSYFTRTPMALYGCGASIIEDAGQAFLKSVKGSYTSILGLPLFELRQALHEIEFKF